MMTEVISSTPKTFANNFWGKDDAGYTVLTAKMANSKKTFDDLRSFYTVRSSLHEEFGKKLLKHLKNDLGRDETGTLGILLASAYRELEMTAQANLELAQKIKVNLELRLDNFILDQKDKRKLVQTNVDKAHRNKQLHTAHVAKAKEKYESECVKQISYEGQLTTAGLREADRLRQKLDKCSHDIAIFEQEYKSACAKLADATAVWDTEWKYACDKYQEMEEKRVEFMHHSFSVYVNILSTTTNQDQESSERFWQALEQCDPKKDVDVFIDEKGTGPMIPDPPVYVHYMDDPAKTLPTYHTAQFPYTDKKTSSSDSGMGTSANSNHVQQENGTSPINNTTKPLSRNAHDTTNNPAYSADADSLSNINHTNEIIGINHRSPAPQQRIAKQLPAISKKEVTRKKTSMDTSNIHQRTPTSSSSSLSGVRTTTSGYTIDSENGRDSNSNDDHSDDDVAIDPRAKVVFAIGNNIFEVDNKQKAAGHFRQQDQHKKTPQWNKRTSEVKTNEKENEAFDLSIKELLEELGVFGSNSGGAKRGNDQSNASDSSVGNVENSSGMVSTSEHQQSQQKYSSQQQQQQQHEQKQSMYMQLQQNYASDGDQHGRSTSPQQPTYAFTGSAMPPYQEGVQWARALYDHQAADGYLNFTRGNWLAVVRIENDSWCLAYLWDDVTGSLSTTPGYVASNFIQFVQ
ncbi:hypothetical protein BCR42DRAFT_415250 [Absidia repens]|uniref:F-BAR domain-containing protein n=1 Tax=Absidia repens TaxID=90262 RepID=A0A1X2IH87_9FUNG|nr:hypothetical protein BCR42DRAFT_415250 [Absidia repens]